MPYNNLEALLTKFLKGLNENVFVKSTDSISGEEEILHPVVEDMEAVIKISGEWDREDLKTILSSLFSELEREIENMKKNESSKGWEENGQIFYSYGDKQAYNSALSDVLKLFNREK